MYQYTAHQIIAPSFRHDGEFHTVIRGYGTTDDVAHALVTIDGQKRWNPAVRDGMWLSGAPETVGARRKLLMAQALKKMWMVQEMVTIDPERCIQYVVLDAGGGMPVKQAVLRFDISSGGADGTLTLDVTVRFRLGLAFSLLKGLVSRKLAENMRQSLPNILPAAPMGLNAP